jgi:tetratricopeptide (TPR) repeat protein
MKRLPRVGVGILEDSRDKRTKIDFSGDGETVVQAGTVHGGVHFNGPKSAGLPVPRQLPSGTTTFINRMPSLTQLSRLLDDASEEESESSPPITVVTAIGGAPGVGKTALAVHWARQVRDRFPDGDLYIDMRGYGSTSRLSEEQALDKFLRSLGVTPELIPIDIEERAALYRSVVSSKRLLIVIDNVSSVRQVRRLLPGSRRCFVVITTRGSLSSLVAREGATRVTLDVLTPEDAVRLLAEVIGDDRIDREDGAARRIAEQCSYLPLALRVVAERAASRPYASLAELAGELVSEQRRLDALVAEDELNNVRAVFSWSYRALSAEQQRTFRAIGLHAGTEFSTEALSALTDLPFVGEQLRELAKVHLIQEIGPQRYKVHDLLRAYSAELAFREDQTRARTLGVRRMLTWYLLAADAARHTILPYSQQLELIPPEGYSVPEFSTVESAMNWYELERLNIIAGLQQAVDLGQYDIAWRLPIVSDGFFEIRAYWREWKEIHTEALAAAQIIHDAPGEASARRCLGDACWRFGEYSAALTHYERSAKIANSIGDPWIEGFSTRGSGLIFEEQGNYDRAMPYFERAYEIFEANQIRRGVGMSLLSLGRVYRGLGELPRAADRGESAVGIFRDMGDRWSLAWGLLPLGEIYVDMQQFDHAAHQFEESIEIFHDFGDRRSEATGLSQLGNVFRLQGNNSLAREFLTNALNIFELLSDPRVSEVRAHLAEISQQGS